MNLIKNNRSKKQIKTINNGLQLKEPLQKWQQNQEQEKIHQFPSSILDKKKLY